MINSRCMDRLSRKFTQSRMDALAHDPVIVVRAERDSTQLAESPVYLESTPCSLTRLLSANGGLCRSLS